MKRNRAARMLALALAWALALAVPAVTSAEELGEVGLYDPEVHVGAVVAPSAASGGVESAPADDAADGFACDETIIADIAADGYVPDETVIADIAADDTASDESIPADIAADGIVPDESVIAGIAADGTAYDESVSAPAEDSDDVLLAPAEDAAPGEAPSIDGASAAAEGAAPADPEAADLEAAEGEASAEPEGEAPPEGENAETEAAANEELLPHLVMGAGERYPVDWAGQLPEGSAVAAVTSSDAEVADVDPLDGALVAVKPGKAVLTIESETGETTPFRVEVKEAPDAIAFPSSGMLMGKKELRTLQVKLPEGSASARIAYATSKSSVVAVDADGRIYARKTGSAWISATTYNGRTAYCKVTVRNAPKWVALSAGWMALCVDESSKLAARLPKKTASALTWTSSDPAVVTVDDQGALRGVAPGTATVTVTTFNGRRASCTVKVLEGDPPTQLELNVGGLWMGKKESFQLVPSVGEGEETVYGFSSSNKRVATVSGSGVVYAKKKGTAKIRVWTHNGLYRVIKVKVSNPPKKVSLSAGSIVLNEGLSARLSAKLTKKTYSRLAWASSNPAVVEVDETGLVTAVAPGTATIGVRTYNNRKAWCTVTVLPGKPPTQLKLNVDSVQMGRWETFLISPEIGPDEETIYAFASSKPKVATVSQNGVIYAKKKGTATIGVRTHNGLTAYIRVNVAAAPSVLALSASRLDLQPGDTAQLAYRLSGASTRIEWTSSDESVATVDNAGVVTALKDGTAVITAKTYNGVQASCGVTVKGPASEPPETPTEPSSPEPPAEEPPAEEPPVSVKARMAANLRADSSLNLGGKKEAIIGVVELLIDNGFEPAFAAGVASNIYSEGTYGLFESSKYVSSPEKRPRYFAYLDGGNYYAKSNGQYALSAVYLTPDEYEAYSGPAAKYLCFGEKNYYLNRYSKRYAQDVNLTELEAFLAQLSKGGWTGKFGLGVVQWTGGRTKTLVGFYRKHAGSGSSSITKAQVIAAENEMILYELKGAYKSVYTTWLNKNADRTTIQAANSAGALVCTKYEVPADKDAKAITRGARAAAIYQVMIGG